MNYDDSKEQQGRLHRAIGNKIYTIVPETKVIAPQPGQRYLTGIPRNEIQAAQAAENYATLTVFLVGESTQAGGHILRTIADVTSFIAEHSVQ